MPHKFCPRWNPYGSGILAGILLVLSVWGTGHFFGASTTFVRAAGVLSAFFTQGQALAYTYFSAIPPKLDWQGTFLTGVFLGALLASITSKSFRLTAIPCRWQTRFGPSLVRRSLAAFLGGMIAMFGARLADGCPSGHGLSGAAQLSAGSLIALCCFFVGGMLTAHILYKKRS